MAFDVIVAKEGGQFEMSARTHTHPTPILTGTIFPSFFSRTPTPTTRTIVAAVRITHPHGFTSERKKRKNGMPFLISLSIIFVC